MSRVKKKLLVNYDDYIVRDHRVHQVRIMPGVTFLDVIYRVMIAEGWQPDQIVIKNVIFKEPLAVSPENSKQVRIFIEELNKGWSASISSESAEPGLWIENVTAAIEKISLVTPRSFPISDLINGANSKIDFEDVYNIARQVHIEHFDFMKVHGEIYLGESYLVAQVRLGDLAAAYLPHFHIHPTYMDSATLMPFLLLASQTELKPSIPLHIESVITNAKPGQTVYFLLDRSEMRVIEDIQQFTIRILNEEATVAVTLEKLTAKQIRHSHLITKLVSPSSPKSKKNNSSAEQDIGEKPSEDGLENRSVNASGYRSSLTMATDCDAITTTIVKLVSDILKESPDTISSNLGFYELGLDSTDLLLIVEQLETVFAAKLYPTLLFEYPNIPDLKNYLSQRFPLFNQEHSAPPLVACAGKEEATLERRTPTASNHQKTDNNAIAIVGIAGRYPEAMNLDEFWNNLSQGKNCINEIPRSRWDKDRLYSIAKDQEGLSNSQWGGFLSNFDCFDPFFFNISPAEASLMAPTERLWIEVVWEAMENAGLTRKHLERLEAESASGVGVFVGSMYNHYPLLSPNCETDSLLGVHSYWSMANRVSNILNIHGPSLAVDSACSSSLTAVHMACEAILSGQCKAAIAGGVNLSLHPSKYLTLTRLNLLSRDRFSRGLGESDGYVPGEGVGAVILKNLESAIADNDPIIAVIKATTINQNGKSGGFSIPNPKAQTQLVENALIKAGIDKTDIDYIEVAANGSPLGDPIEIQSLATVFASENLAEKKIRIGTVKSNVGHLEAASGICALSKVILQLQNQSFVPSINAQPLNPKIDLDNTCFVLQNTKERWPENENYPRRAAISSFGAGGSNAHIIVEEYPQGVATKSESETVHLFLLSAKTRRVLREYSARLIDFVKRQGEALSLADTAYTLIHGREHWEERLAITAQSHDDLVEKLSQFLSDSEKIAPVFQGNIKKDKNRLQLLLAGRAGDVIIEKLLAADKETIAKLWTLGYEIDWSRFSFPQTARRIALPSYPFIGAQYSIEKKTSPLSPLNTKLTPLHHMLDRNSSTLMEQVFEKRFCGWEFYLKDHIVNGKRILPAVAYLEMAYQAATLSGVNNITAIEKVYWLSPLEVLSEGKNVYTAIHPAPDSVSCVDFEIFTEDLLGERLIHSRGRLSCHAKNSSEKFNTSPSELMKDCRGEIASTRLYEHLKQCGFAYGPTLRSVTSIRYCSKEAIATIHLDGHIENEFFIHPAILDGVLQSASVLIHADSWMTEPEAQIFSQASSDDKAPNNEAYLPFAIESFETFQSIDESCLAHVHNYRDNGTTKKMDITLFSQKWQAIAKITGFSLRRLEKSAKLSDDQEKSPVFWCKEIWQQAPLASPATSRSHATLMLFDVGNARATELKASWAEVILIEPGECYKQIDKTHYQIAISREDDYTMLFDDLSSHRFTATHIAFLLPLSSRSDESLAEYLSAGSVYALFQLTKTLVKNRLLNPVHLLYLFQADDGYLSALHQAVFSFAKSLFQENTNFIYKILELHDDDAISQNNPILTALLNQELGEGLSRPQQIKMDRGIRSEWVSTLIADKSAPKMEEEKPHLVDDGVYLISGGLGGLGRIFVEYIASRVRARIVIFSRRSSGEESDAVLSSLKIHDSKIEYLACDVTSEVEVQKLITSIKRDYGRIDGIIHAAGLINDNYLITKKIADMLSVIRPKMLGAIYLDHCTREEKLDFFIVCSSLSAVTGNGGQSDYAFANGFLDRFTRFRESLRLRDLRSGSSVTINWPLWREGGMHMDPKMEQRIKERYGFEAIDREEGLATFELALTLHHPQLIMLKGERQKISAVLNLKNDAAARGDAKDPIRQTIQEVEMTLTELFAELLKVAGNEIDSHDQLDQYGVDSIMMIAALNRIERLYNRTVDPDLLATYTTIATLAEHLVSEGVSKLEQLIKGEELTKVKPDEKLLAPALRPPPAHRGLGLKHDDDQRIAVIGMSGRFPESPTVEVFWENLKRGRNLIKEVPSDRWNMMDHYSADKTDPMKSYSKWGGFITDVDLFAADYFGIDEDDAMVMDPAHRLLLEECQHLFDRAGYQKEELDGSRTGVFIGAAASSYISDHQHLLANGHMKRLVVHMIQNMTAARISDFFNLKGPALTLDTACSSSLIAIDQAISGLNSGAIDMAIAGGIELILNPLTHIGFSKAGVLADGPLSHVFDEKAGGFVTGEGLGLVLLKPYRKAEADGDHIIATILSSAVNNDGRTMGLTVPSLGAQEEVITHALHKAKIDPTSIGYFEAHGTGTLLGDPIEVKAATRAYRRLTEQQEYCAIGSVKSNMGHALRAAGIASFIKVMLALKHQFKPPTLNCNTPHPRFQFPSSPFYPIKTGENWIANTKPRRAAISSFGFGGTNCHIIVEEFLSEANSNYVAKRAMLLPTFFSKKRLWLGKKIEVITSSDALTEEFYLSLVRKVEAGKIDIDTFFKLINEKGPQRFKKDEEHAS